MMDMEEAASAEYSERKARKDQLCQAAMKAVRAEPPSFQYKLVPPVLTQCDRVVYIVSCVCVQMCQAFIVSPLGGGSMTWSVHGQASRVIDDARMRLQGHAVQWH